ncbi:MAG: hypothetical protein A2782_01565 [Candidatus Blackburnbacteria bacterium RIFCSPHIGHO2_01_FULL_43_15b]|uniref:Uncharacterized protein n=1 Tax=Candidatus Blackburnbacteria bacterium RIFCSPHIGHO2_01_FULL_43_15b TaxID=1797513 RepID=A0A1G1UXI4_9BACT|nr:MAG: hypothetical protein A2782_01565 [Candidatus Blackburnbacteria bacterium RIFCSPHIGHO2_01_FULL_43_15b]
MTKRQKFVLSSLLLASGFVLMQYFVETGFRYQTIALLTILTAVFSYWSLKEALGRNATLLTLVLPTFFTAGVGLFYFLLPASILSAIPIVLLYILGIYALLLTSNIYTVAAARTIALLRAAHAVGFLLTLLTAFLLFDNVFSLRASFWLNGLASALLAFPLLLQGFWSIELGHKLGKEVLFPAVALALILGEVGVVLSFWPVTVPVASLALTTVLYVGLGTGQARLQQRLFARTIREYFLVGAVVFITMFLTARWAG